jgi:hypothetical protein
MEIIFLVIAVVVGLFILKSVAGVLKFFIKLAIYAVIGIAIWRGLVYFGVLK